MVNRDDNTVSQYQAGAGGDLHPLTPATAAAGNRPFWIAVTPDGHHAYVTNTGDRTVSQFDIGPNGALQPKSPPTVLAGHGRIEAFSIAVSPDGKSVYVANGEKLLEYDVAGDGTLSAKRPAAVDAGRRPVGVAVSPDGRSVYVANSGDDSVSQYDVHQGGALTPKSPASVPTGPGPHLLAASSDGKNVYVTSLGRASAPPSTAPASPAPASPAPASPAPASPAPSARSTPPRGSAGGPLPLSSGAISQHEIRAGGGLQTKSQAPAGVSRPEGVAVSPDSKSVYVADAGAGSVAQYDVGSSGVLHAKTPAKVKAGAFAGDIVISADGKNAYVTNRGADTVAHFDVGHGGALQERARARSGSSPVGIAAGPRRLRCAAAQR